MIGEKAAKGLRPFAPQPFGRYTLLAPLASGGMGEVFLARLDGVEGFEKQVVIKKILPQLAHDQDFRDRFVSEARVLVKLHHGSVAQVLDMGELDGEYYIALEFVDGKDLRKVAARCRERGHTLPLGLTLFVMMRVLDALAYAHRKTGDDEQALDLVHRDVSPQNVLISYEGEVKVIDFGLAKSSLSLGHTSPSVVLGKFFYMSPEQALHAKVDRRSDLYAAGICLYELIAGTNPFESVPQGELMSRVARPQIEPLSAAMPGVPPAVEQLVMRALAPDPKDRFTSAEEMRGRVMSAMLELDPGAGPESLAHFMRAVFSAEFAQERKAFAALRGGARTDHASAGKLRLAVDDEPPESAARVTQAVPWVAITPANAETNVGPLPAAMQAGPATRPNPPATPPAEAPAVRADDPALFSLPSGRDTDTTRPADVAELEGFLVDPTLDSPTEGPIEFTLPDEEDGADSKPASLQFPTAPMQALRDEGRVPTVPPDDPQEFRPDSRHTPAPAAAGPGARPKTPPGARAASRAPTPRGPASAVPGPPVISSANLRVAPPPRPAPRAALPKVVIADDLIEPPPEPARPPRPRPPERPAPAVRRPGVGDPPPAAGRAPAPSAPSAQPDGKRTSLYIRLAMGAGLVLLLLAGFLAWSLLHAG